jgi:hypothetical protein
MKAIRTIVALLFLAVSAGALAGPLVHVRAAGPAMPQNLLRIAQIISKRTSANPIKLKFHERKSTA